MELVGEVKVCTECGIEKDLSEFGCIKGTKNYHDICRKCRKAKKNKEWENKNQEKSKDYHKKYRQTEKCKEGKKKYYENNKEKILLKSRENNKKYYQKNKEIVDEKHKKYREENKDKIKAHYQDESYKKSIAKSQKKRIESGKIAEYSRNRRKTNLDYKLSVRLSNSINEALRAENVRKFNKTLVLLGCDIDFFKKHIESQFQEGMSWENHGIHGWHFDHIVPCAFFSLSKEENQKICFNYRNLRPLWAKDNLLKKKKLPPNVFEVLYDIREGLNLN